MLWHIGGISKMTLKERSKLYFGGDKESVRNMPLCINCEHFHQHYVKGPMFVAGEAPLDGGHCTFFRRRRRYYFAYDTCEHFQQRTQERNADGIRILSEEQGNVCYILRLNHPGGLQGYRSL